MTKLTIKIIGAGITGLWQALILAKRGHHVRLIDKSSEPFTESASQYAGAMIAPHCEAEIGGPLVENLGLASLEIWKAHYPAMTQAGSLVLTQAREKPELKRFARQTNGHREINADEIASLEPDLKGRYTNALYFADETHMDPFLVLPFLVQAIRDAGGDVTFGVKPQDEETTPAPALAPAPAPDWTIDCRGLDAADDLKDLRGVRGERLVIRSTEVKLNHAIHLLHPRFPIYIVPWPDNLFMIGATMIETDSKAPVSVRSALELLSAAYALHPAFAEAEIECFDVGVRPAFPDNLPKIVLTPGKLYVNGLYRNGYLLAPQLAVLVADYLETGTRQSEVFVEDYFER